MRVRTAIFLVSLLVATPVVAQESARTADGSVATVVPDPTFLPDDVVAIVQMRGLLALAPKISALTEGLMPAEDVEKFMSTWRDGFGAKNEFAGLHPFRPIFLGLYDPADIDGPMTPPERWREWSDIGAVGVVAVPIVSHALFQTTLAKALGAGEKTGERSWRFDREVKKVDYEAWSAWAAQSSEPVSVRELERFTTTEHTFVYYVAADSYALLTTNPKIAGDAAKSADRPLAWRKIGVPPSRPEKEKSLRTVTTTEDGRVFDPSDDVLMTLNVGRLMRRHRSDWKVAIGRLEDDIARWSAADRASSPDELVRRRAAGRGLRTYVDMITAAGEDMRAVEIGLQYDGRALAVRMTAIPENPGVVTVPVPHTIDSTELARSAKSAVFGFQSSFGPADRLNVPMVLTRVLALWHLDLSGNEWRNAAERWVQETGASSATFDVAVRQDDAGGFIIDGGVTLVPEANAGAVLDALGVYLRDGLRRDGERVNVRELGAADPLVREWTLELGDDGEGLDHAEIAAHVVKGRLSLTIARKDAAKRLEERASAPTATVPPSMRVEALRAEKTSGVGFIDVFGLMAAMRRATAPEVAADPATHRAFIVDQLTKKRDDGFVAINTKIDARSTTWSCRIPRAGLSTYSAVFDAGRDWRKSEMTRIRAEILADGLDNFFGDHGRYPTADEGLAALLRAEGTKRPALSSFQSGALEDGWNRPFDYLVRADGSVAVRSLGRDHAVGGESADADVTRELRR